MANKHKVLKRWRRQAESEGWRVELTKGGHMQWFAPDGETIVVTPSSPGGGRAMANSASQLRACGLDVQP